MLVLILAAIVLGVWAFRRRRRGRDLPAWLVTVAARWVPVDRREWAEALVAEFAAVRTCAARWAYAAAVVRMAVLPPARRPQRQVRAAVVAASGSAGLSTVAILTVPTLAPFVVTLAVLLAGYVTLRAGRSTTDAVATARGTVACLAVVGIAATVAVLWAVGALHPSATDDRAHVLSALLAVALTAYLGFAQSRPIAHGNTIGYSAAAGAILLVGVTAVTTLARPVQEGPASLLSLPGFGVCLLVAGVVAVSTGDAGAARRAGLLTAILAAPLQFAVGVVGLLTVHSWSLTTAYDHAAYARSGYPDVASYMISDDLAGHLIAGILIGPLILGVVAAIVASAAARLRRGPAAV